MSQSQGLDPFGQETGISAFGKAFLDQMPEADRETMRPHVISWDRNVSKEFQRRDSDFKPFKELVDAGFSVDDVRNSLQLMNALQEDPGSTLKTLADAYGITIEQAAQAVADAGTASGTSGGDSGAGDFSTIFQSNEFKELKDMVENVAKLQLNQFQTTQQQEEDRILNDALNKAKEDHGDFDEEIVIPLIQSNGGDVDAAVKKFKELVPNYGTRSTPPPVLHGGGSLPATQVTAESLRDPKTRQDLIKGLLDKVNSS